MNHPLIRNYREGRIDLRRLNSSQRAVLAAVLNSELASAEEKKLRALGALATMSKVKLAAQRVSTNANYVYRARRIQQHDAGLLRRVLDGQLSLTEAERQLAKDGKGLPNYQAPEERGAICARIRRGAPDAGRCGRGSDHGSRAGGT
jgi:hypothetical protein